MDGFGLVMTLCFTALLSSLIYAAAWTIAPSATRDGYNG